MFGRFASQLRSRIGRAFFASLVAAPIYFHLQTPAIYAEVIIPPVKPVESQQLPPQVVTPLKIEFSDTIPDKISEYDDKNIIIYFMSGNSEQDQQIKRLVDRYHDSYNRNVHVIFINPSINHQFAPLQSCFLTKRNYSKNIQKICFAKQIEQLSEGQFLDHMVNKLERFIKNIPQIDMDGVARMKASKVVKVALKADKNSQEYTKYRILFQNFMQKSFMFKKIEFLIVADEETAVNMGLQFTPQGSIHMLVPSDNELLKVEAQNHYFKLGNQEYCLVKDVTNDAVLKEHFVFMPFANQSLDNLLQLKINNNKISKQDKEQLFSLCKSLNEAVHIRYANIDKNYQFVFSLHDDLSYKILKEQMPELTIQQKIQHLTTPKEYMYKGAYKKEDIEVWLQKVRLGQVEPYYRSEKPPKIDLHSHKLTGKNFQQILVSTDNQVVFYYSDKCHNCAKFGQIYETIARQNYSDDKLVMNHIEVQKNEMSCGYNVPITPSLSFFKLECKTRPFNYDLKFLNRTAVNNFIEITKDVKLVDDEVFNKFVESRVGYNYHM